MRTLRYMIVDETSGMAELEKHAEPKARLVEGIIFGAIMGAGFTLLLIAVITFLRFHVWP